MKSKIRFAITCVALILGSVGQSRAQNLVQPLTMSLTIYDPAANGPVVFGAAKFASYLMGSNVPNAHLYLVTPMGNVAGQLGALGAFLRITSGTTTVYQIPSVSQFNLYQDFAAFRSYSPSLFVRALNRFSFDTGSVRAEWQGISLWTILQQPVNGVDLSGAGAFTCTFNGWIQIHNGTSTTVSASGIIVAGTAKPE